jgi:predicted ArsR family transcriptional regulator
VDEVKGLERAVAALQDPTRRAILLAFYREPAARTVAEVAETAGVHRSVVYTHLEKLLALGYLVSGQRHGRPGKPAKTYQLSGVPLSFQHPTRDFLTLSRILGATVADLGGRGLARARERAAAAGRALAGAAADLPAALEPLEQLGDHYALAPGQKLIVDSCAFREACALEPSVVSTIHAGLIEGLLDGAGFVRQVRPQACDARGCVFSIEPTNRTEGADATAA